MRCERYMFVGPRCELEKGHDGSHQATRYSWKGTGPNAVGTAIGVIEWDDESQTRMADKYGSRLD